MNGSGGSAKQSSSAATNDEAAKAVVTLDPDDLLEVGVSAAQAQADTALDSLVFLSSVYVQLSLFPEFHREMEQLTDQRRKKQGKPDLMDNAVGSVEVSWNGRIESVSFRLPDESRYLSETTKAAFMRTCDLSTSEKRMKTLFEHLPAFIAEMERIFELAQAFPIYRLVATNVAMFKNGLYALVVLLNINVMMVTFDRSSGHGYNSLFVTALSPPGDKAVSVAFTVLLVLALVAGYSVLIVYHGVTEIPILIKRTDERTAGDLSPESPIKPDNYRDWSAFSVWGAALGFNLLFIFMHATNYGGGGQQGGASSADENQANRLYLFLLFGISFPWTLSCVRNWIVVPHTPASRRYVLVFDAIVRRSFLRNNAVLIGLCVAGFVRNEFFSLMLLDIINNSPLLANILKCVTIPRAKLQMVFFLFLVTAAIYAHFAVAHFEGSMTFSPKGEGQDCHSAVSCFWLILYKAVPSKKLDPIMRPMTNRHKMSGEKLEGAADYQLRMLFDLTFYIWVGILLMSIITGLMLDTFG